MSSEQKKHSNEDPTSKVRKADHIEMAFDSQVTQQLIDPRFYYEPLLSGHPDGKEEIRSSFLGSLSLIQYGSQV